ncbi:hypothetical protein P5V15_012914 [Pogonomyrmex californicus]
MCKFHFKKYCISKLPSLDDIKLLYNFLQTNRRSAFQRLTQFTLISVQIFNRRRAGEIEQISIDDYRHQEGINKKQIQIYTHLYLMKLEKYICTVLLDCEMKKCIDLLLRYRKETNIPDKNPYIFNVEQNCHSDYGIQNSINISQHGALR